jgi:hypothetical protein
MQGGIFLLQWNLENWQLGEKDNNLSHQQMGPAWPAYPGVEAQGQAQSCTHAATQAATRMPTKKFSEQVRGLAGLRWQARRD